MAKANNNNTVLNIGNLLSLKAKDGHEGKEVEISFKHGIINFNTSIPISSILNTILPSDNNTVKSTGVKQNNPVPKKRKG